jgi:hypothetical protein
MQLKIKEDYAMHSLYNKPIKAKYVISEHKLCTLD